MGEYTGSSQITEILEVTHTVCCQTRHFILVNWKKKV